jgi:hypothetical protein
LKRRVVELGLLHWLSPNDLIAAEQDRHADLAGKLTQHRIALRIPERVLEVERRRRLRPDDVLRTPPHGVAGHGEVGRENAPRMGRIPFVFLRDVALQTPG